jgi:hypothetical protein
LSNVGGGISNLTSSDPAIRKAAMEKFAASGATMKNTALPMYMGYTGTVALDEMDKLKEEQDIENARIAAEQAEFDARINKGRESAIAAMQANPYMYATGGEVDPKASPDLIKQMTMAGKMPSMYEMRQMNVPDVMGGGGGKKYMMQSNLGYDVPLNEDTILSLLASGNLSRERGLDIPSYGAGIMKKMKDGELSGYAEKNDMTGEKRYGAKYTKRFAEGGDVPGFGIKALANKPEQYGGETATYAAGGQPRYLSGGGDGMSDSIPATINGNQPARLADGEFVIPADVVSHLGNGSSKAGAKQLYSMMDKVRSARTGTKKQGRQINPNKFLPA